MGKTLPVLHLSTTLISGWQQCPARSWRSYERRIEHGDDNEGTNPTRFGTVVHNTSEEIHERLMRGEDVDNDLIVATFDKHWRQNTCTDFEYFSFGRDRIESFLNRSIYDRRGETIAVELLFVIDLEPSHVRTDGRQPVWINPDNPKEIAQLIKDRGGVPAISKIDRLDRIDDTTFEVFDYKTNIMPFTRYYIETSQQLGLYDLAVRAIYPEATDVTCIYDMLRHGRYPVQFDDLFRENLVAFLVNLYHQICQTETGKLEERINEYCRWCERRADCAAYAAAMDSVIPPVLTEVLDCEEGLSLLQEELDHLNSQKKIIEERAKEVKEMLTAKIIMDNDGQPLAIGDKEIYLSPNKRREVNVPAFFDTLKANNAMVLLKNNMSISVAAAERMAKQHPAIKEAVEATFLEKHNSPSLKVRKRGSKAGSDGDDVE